MSKQSPNQRQTVTIFGSSTVSNQSKEYSDYVQLGKQLADLNFNVMTGGYSGSMEAISKGASLSENNVEIIGVISSTLFPHRNLKGNMYLNKVIDMTSLPDRIAYMVNHSDIFITLPGQLGTANEFVMVWCKIYCQSAYTNSSTELMKKVKLIASKDPWQKYVQFSEKLLGMSPQSHCSQNIQFYENVKDIADLLNK